MLNVIGLGLERIGNKWLALVGLDLIGLGLIGLGVIRLDLMRLASKSWFLI